MKKLPIGIQTFEKLIEGNCYYVDKTRFISELTQAGDYYFLSRPRRFGKSLFLSTIKAAYQGKQDLDQLETVLFSLFASIPHDWYRKNQLAGYDGY